MEGVSSPLHSGNLVLFVSVLAIVGCGIAAVRRQIGDVAQWITIFLFLGGAGVHVTLLQDDFSRTAAQGVTPQVTNGALVGIALAMIALFALWVWQGYRKYSAIQRLGTVTALLLMFGCFANDGLLWFAPHYWMAVLILVDVCSALVVVVALCVAAVIAPLQFSFRRYKAKHRMSSQGSTVPARPAAELV